MSEQSFLKTLYDCVASYDPRYVTEKTGSKYTRTYYHYNNIKICVVKNKIDQELQSLTITKI